MRDQVQPAAACFDAHLEAALVDRQRVGEKGNVERELDDLRTQLVGGAQAHVRQRHLLQIGNVPFEKFQRLAQLQRDQSAQPRAMPGGGDIGFVEDFDLDMRVLVDQRRKTDEALRAAADLHQLG